MVIWPLVISGLAILVIGVLMYKQRHEHVARLGYSCPTPESNNTLIVVGLMDEGDSLDDA
jgi:hypothetical protein